MRPLIDGLGHATRSATVPVSRSQSRSFQQNRHFSSLALKLLVSLISSENSRRQTDRHTHTETKHCNPRCACQTPLVVVRHRSGD